MTISKQAIMKKQEVDRSKETSLNPTEKNENIFVAYKGQYVNLKPEEILWVTSEGNYAQINTKENQYINRISLTGLLKLLPPHQFIKIHKCHIVQINAISRIDKTNNEVVVNHQKIPIGRSFKSTLFNSLKLIH